MRKLPLYTSKNCAKAGILQRLTASLIKMTSAFLRLFSPADGLFEMFDFRVNNNGQPPTRRQFMVTLAAFVAASCANSQNISTMIPGRYERTDPRLNKNESKPDKLKEIISLGFEHNDLPIEQQLPESVRVAKLIELLNVAIKEQNVILAPAAAEQLAIYSGVEVAKALITAFDAFPLRTITASAIIEHSENHALQKYISQLIALNFSVSQGIPERKILLPFVFKTMSKPENETSAPVRRSMYSTLRFIGNMTFLGMRRHLRNVRLKDHSGRELWKESFFDFMIKFIYPDFNAFERFGDDGKMLREYMIRHYGMVVDYHKMPKEKDPGSKGKTPEMEVFEQKLFSEPEAKISLWREQLKSPDASKKIEALLSLDEILVLPTIPEYADMLLNMLDDPKESPQVKAVIIAIIGSSFILSRTHPLARKVRACLADQNEMLALAAAKAIRFKYDQPTEDILLALEKISTNSLYQQIGDHLFSSVMSPDGFNMLIWSILSTDPKNTDELKRRLDELRVWYVRLGDERDKVVRQALQGESENLVKAFNGWLRNLSMLVIHTSLPAPAFVQSPSTWQGFTADPVREAALKDDPDQFEQFRPTLERHLLKKFRRAFKATVPIAASKLGITPITANKPSPPQGTGYLN